jgi:5-methylthioribose kinase
MTRLAIPHNYHPMESAQLPQYLSSLDEVATVLAGDPGRWQVQEVGDGNLNLVFIVQGETGSVVVKQALPYLRLVGDAWPLPLKRAEFEYRALIEQGRHACGLVPKVYHFDTTLALIVMEHLTPHIILRKGLIQGIRYPKLAGDIAEFMAQTLFKTSDLHTPAAEKKEKMAFFCDNIELCRITEELIFTDPYRVSASNRWTSPQLDTIAAEFRRDTDLKLASQYFKLKFLSSAEALIHGDLHSGSVMVTQSDTRIIDPEFAFYGPMGFDIGAYLGNLLLAFFAQEGHVSPADTRDEYREWLLEQFESTWSCFERRFLELWRESGTGDAFTAELFNDSAGTEALERGRQSYMQHLFADTLGFGGMKMIRRILGLAHVADLETIQDRDLRGQCERQALAMGRELVVNHTAYGDIRAVTDKAREILDEVKA